MQREDITPYYILGSPTLTDLKISCNNVSVGQPITISMSITQSPRYLQPETYYPSELYSGEVTK